MADPTVKAPVAAKASPTIQRHAQVPVTSTSPASSALANQQKGLVVNYAFTVLAVGIVIYVFIMVAYYNYLMIAEYTIPMLMALLVAMPLAYIRDAFIASIESAEHKLGFDQRPILATLTAIFVPILSVGVGVLTILYIPQVFGALAFPLLALIFFCVALGWKSRREFLITVAVIVFLLVIVLFPMFFLVKSCFEESVVATDAVVKWIKTNEQLKELVADHRNNSVYKQVAAYSLSWGYDLDSIKVETIKEQAMELVQVLGNHAKTFFGTSVALLSNIGNMVVSFVVFSTTLFTMVLYKRQIWNELADLSPFSGDEQDRIITSVASSISRILAFSAVVGIINFAMTWITFWLTGLPLTYIFSALTAFLAIIPLSGTWLIWLPATGVLFARADYFGMLVMIAGHLIAYGMGTAVVGYLPGNSHLVGMSIALGLSTYGPAGVIMGPLLVGILATFTEIYKEFYGRRLSSNDLVRTHGRSQTTY